MLSDAATHDDFEMATICLSHGANPNTNLIDEHLSILAAVADLTYVGMARLLLKHGALLRESDAIIKAAEAGKLGMVRVLLEEGADPNEVGIEHPTDLRYKGDIRIALHRAVVGGHEEIVGSLLAHGAAISPKDPMGRTRLALALDQGIEVFTVYSSYKAGENKLS